MKLTQDDFRLLPENDGMSKIVCKTKVCKQILDDQAKAELYDFGKFADWKKKAEKYESIIEYVGNHKGLFSHNVKEWIEKLEQENKHLNEKLEKMLQGKSGTIQMPIKQVINSQD